jgi:tRNA dimethylallyltransferase
VSTPAFAPVLCLRGATACGKTALAIAAAQRWPLDVISVDSALIYRGMDIGTAKPEPAVRARIAHALIDIRDPGEAYSAAAFRRDALAAIASSHRRGRIPLLVGGTFLYFRALEQGLSELPEANPVLREELTRAAAQAGWPALHQRLAALDPEAAARIHPQDAQRLQRALEVVITTGVPLSVLQRTRQGPPPGLRFLRVTLAAPERADLHRRIAQRFEAMLEAGFEAEVEALRARGDLVPALPALRAVGYRQMWRYLDGELSRAEMVSQALAATRQYAKRQLTWLRHEGVGSQPVTRAEAIDALAGMLGGELRGRPTGHVLD